jgi:hypothetical protein
MVTSEERMKVLKMIEEDAISVGDGAKLLAALEGQQTGKSRARGAGGPRDPRMLRVRVDDTLGGKMKVNVVLPMALVDAGLSIASNFIEGLAEEHTLALSEAIRSGETGMVIDVQDETDGEHVQVFIE